MCGNKIEAPLTSNKILKLASYDKASREWSRFRLDSSAHVDEEVKWQVICLGGFPALCGNCYSAWLENGLDPNENSFWVGLDTTGTDVTLHGNDIVIVDGVFTGQVTDMGNVVLKVISAKVIGVYH